MTLAAGKSGPYTPVSYAYDNLSRLNSLTVGGQTYTYGYGEASPLVQTLTRPDGSVTAYQYDVLNRLTHIAGAINDSRSILRPPCGGRSSGN